MDDFNLTYANQMVILDLEDGASLSLSLSGGEWKDASVTITSNYAALYSSSSNGYVSTNLFLYMPTITTVTIGSSYSDLLLQDFIVYDSPLNNRTAHPLAGFLSKCYCHENFNETSDSCVNASSGAVSPR